MARWTSVAVEFIQKDMFKLWVVSNNNNNKNNNNNNNNNNNMENQKSPISDICVYLEHIANINMMSRAMASPFYQTGKQPTGGDRSLHYC